MDRQLLKQTPTALSNARKSRHGACSKSLNWHLKQFEAVRETPELPLSAAIVALERAHYPTCEEYKFKHGLIAHR